MHHWFVSALLASILALVCAMTATARSEGAPFLMLDTGGHQANFGAWHIRQADGISFRLATTRRPRLGLEGEQGSPDHPAAVRAMQRRQDRPLADRDRLQRAHGGFDRSRADGVGRRLSRALDHWLRVRPPDRAPDHDRRPAEHCANHFGPGLDYRRQPVYARPGRSVALGLSARGHLATR